MYKDKHNGMELDVYERGKTGAPPWWVTFRDRIGIIADNLKMNCKMSEALFEAGLTKDEYKYFKVIHPHFADYFESCKMYITNKAKGNVFHHIVEKKDVHVSKWHLETVENKEYKKQLEIKNSEISDDDRLKQLTAEQEYLKYKRKKEKKKS